MGRGGAGVVWKCRHASTGELAAVKVARDTSRRQRDLLRREVAMLSRLGRNRHRGIVRAIETGIDAGRLFYAMEYIEGVELGALLRRGAYSRAAAVGQSGLRPSAVPISATVDSTVQSQRQPAIASGVIESPFGSAALGLGHAEAPRPELGNADDESRSEQRYQNSLWMMAHLADALAFLHADGIVHGDVTPANVVVRHDGAPVLVDFGTAFHTSMGQSAREVAQIEGLLVGTPGFMAPELIRGDALDARCDLYSFGCIAYELLTGHPPLEADSVPGLLRQHVQVAPPAPSTHLPGVDPRLDDLLLALLEKDPRRRLGHAEEVVIRLRELYEGDRPFPETRPRYGLYRSRFVGRDDTAEQLQQALRRACSGKGGRFVVTGDSGVGKTRLLNEIGARAIALHMEVVTGQCAAALPDGSALRGPALQAFLPFLQRLADRAALAPELLREDEHEALGVLVPYEPALGALRTAAAAPPPNLPLDAASARLSHALTTLLVRFGSVQPLLLVLDDMQWADELTISYWVSSQADRLAESRVLVLGSCRSNEGEPRLGAWLQTHPDQRMSVGPLGIPEIRSMATDMLATDLVPDGLAETLFAHSEGNPLFVAEYLRSFLERGLLRQGVDGWSFSPDHTPLRASALPSALRGLVAERIEALSADARTMLQAAALVGREFDRAWLDRILEQTHLGVPARADSALEELVASQVLEEHGSRYRFVHDKLREAATRLVDEERSVSLHGEIARCLESLRDELPTPSDAQLGLHWAHARHAVRALPYLERAAAQAESVHAVSQAIELYSLALQQAEMLASEERGANEASGEPVAAPRIAESLGDVLSRSARHPEARAHYDRALRVVLAGAEAESGREGARSSEGAREGESERESESNRRRRSWAPRLLRKKAQSFYTVHLYADATAALDEAEARLGPPARLSTQAEFVEWIEVQQCRYWTLYFGRRTGAETVALLEAMRPVVQAHGSAIQRSVFYQCVETDILGRGRYAYSEEAVANATRAVEEVTGEPRWAIELLAAQFNLGFALLFGDPDHCRRAADVLAGVAREAERIGHATLLSRALTYQAVASRRVLEVDQTAAVARRARVAAEAARLLPYIGAALACLAWCAWKEGDAARAETDAQAARGWWTRSEHAFPFRWLADLVLLERLSVTDDFERASELLDGLLAPQQQVFPEPLAGALADAARACRAAAPAEAGDALRRVLTLARAGRYL
jgi:serine/threonine protein kinase